MHTLPELSDSMMSCQVVIVTFYLELKSDGTLASHTKVLLRIRLCLLTAEQSLQGTIIVPFDVRRTSAASLRMERVPSEVCKLEGHRHDVLLLQVSHHSTGIATGSKDGCVRVSMASLIYQFLV